jgi:prophage regulatory protein
MATQPQILVYADLRAKGITLSKLQLWRLEKDKQFPRRVEITNRRYGWLESEIDKFIMDRITARDDPAESAVRARRTAKQTAAAMKSVAVRAAKKGERAAQKLFAT